MSSKSVSPRAMIGELRTLTMVTAGLVAGSMAGKSIDKMLKVDPNLPGMSPKKFVRPLVQLAAGAAGSLTFKNNDLKNLSAGVGASGVVSTFKAVAQKDLLAGIGLGNAPVLREAVRSVPAYTPYLPELAAPSVDFSAPETTASETYTDIEFI